MNPTRRSLLTGFGALLASIMPVKVWDGSDTLCEIAQIKCYEGKVPMPFPINVAFALAENTSDAAYPIGCRSLFVIGSPLPHGWEYCSRSFKIIDQDGNTNWTPDLGPASNSS